MSGEAAKERATLVPSIKILISFVFPVKFASCHRVCCKRSLRFAKEGDSERLRVHE